MLLFINVISCIIDNYILPLYYSKSKISEKTYILNS